MMKKNTILRFMGELSGRYLKLVFPEIEPHKCVKKTKRGAEESTEKKDRIRNILYESNRRSRRRRKRRQRGTIYYINLIEGTEEKKDKTDERYKYSYVYIVNKVSKSQYKRPEKSQYKHPKFSKASRIHK